MSEPLPQNVEPVPYWQQPSARPTSVTVIAIVGIVYASLGLLCQSFGILSVAMMRTEPNAGLQIVNSIISILLSLILLPASIGLIYLKPAARRVLLGWAIIAMIFVTGRAIWSIFYVIPQTTDMSAGTPTTMPGNFSPAAMKTIAMVSAGVVWFLTMALPIALLIILRRPRVRDALLQPASAP